MMDDVIKYVGYLSDIMTDIVKMQDERRKIVLAHLESAEVLTEQQTEDFIVCLRDFKAKFDSLVDQYNYFIDKINECDSTLKLERYESK